MLQRRQIILKLKMVSDPLSEERELMEPFAYYYLK